MLKKLRNKKTAKRVWLVLAIIIVPAFVLWGSGSSTRSKPASEAIGKIFGKQVSSLEFLDAKDAVRNAAIIQFGDNLSEVQKFLNFDQQAWQRLILLREAKKRRITANDKEVVALIQSYPFFQRDKGFDDKTYEEILQYYFHTQPRIFEEQTRQNIIISKLYNQITQGTQVSDEDVKNEYRKINEEISIFYIVSNLADFAKNISPTEEDLKGYFAKNSLNFKQPLSYNLQYISLDSEDKVKDAVSRLNKKEGIEKVAKDMGIETKETGLFGPTDPIPGVGWSPDILNLITKLKVGQVTPPVKTEKNFFLFLLKEKKDPSVPEFDKIKDKIKEAYIKERSTEAARAKADECFKKLQEQGSKVDFEKVAALEGLKSGSTGLFKFGTYIEGIGGSDELWLKADELKADQFSAPLSMPGGFYVIKLKSRVPVDTQKFESEKLAFQKKLLAQKQEESFAKFLEELKRKAQ